MKKSIRSLIFACLIVGGASSAPACSVCIAHALGAGLRALGAQTLHDGSTIVGLSFMSFSKSNAGDMPGTTEAHDQTEISLDVMHGLSSQWMLRANLPFVTKGLDMTGAPHDQSKGVGDITLGATYQVPPKDGSNILLAFNFDVKLPTGANNLSDATGTLKDQHGQVGTGSTDFALGIVATMQDGDRGLWFAGLRGRVNGSNDRGYRYGNAWFYNLGYSLNLNPTSSVVLEFNGRFAGSDRKEDGTTDDNSGGHLGYASVSYRRNLDDRTGLVVGYQLPIIKSLYGTQSESPLFSIGVFRKF